MGLFDDRRTVAGKTQVPVWYMRQAGRYHSHYQNIKKNSDFMTMCKTPELAAEITMGPINDFKFDAAILFSDLLFPLEDLGMGLHYNDGPPKLAFHLADRDNLEKLTDSVDKAGSYAFQKEALKCLQPQLPSDCTMLGFVGAPFTLYTYAVEGSHAGQLASAKLGLYDGCFAYFWQKLYPTLIAEMDAQARGGAEAICVFDTAAGELTVNDYEKFVVPAIKQLTEEFKKRHPSKRIIYYSKHTNLNHIHALDDKNIDVIGMDWRQDFVEVQKSIGDKYMIQGNIDPVWLHLNWPNLEANLGNFKKHLDKNNFDYSRWICGLGHGVLQHTPEENVRKSVEWIHQNFVY